MKNLNINQEEIQVLKKLIYFIKFECEDEEASLFSGSKLVNSILKKIMLVDEFNVHQTDRFKNIDNDFKENVLNKLRKEQFYINMSQDRKLEYVNDILFPYKIDEIG